MLYNAIRLKIHSILNTNRQKPKHDQENTEHKQQNKQHEHKAQNTKFKVNNKTKTLKTNVYLRRNYNE